MAFASEGMGIPGAGAMALAAVMVGLAGVILDCAKPLIPASDSMTTVKASPCDRVGLNLLFISVSFPGF